MSICDLVHDSQALAVEIGQALGDEALGLHAAEPGVGVVARRARHEAADSGLLPWGGEGFFGCDSSVRFRSHLRSPLLVASLRGNLSEFGERVEGVA
jgi:hypothetical protein